MFFGVLLVLAIVTLCPGRFFGSGGSVQTSDGTFRLTADSDSDSVNGYTF